MTRADKLYKQSISILNDPQSTEIETTSQYTIIHYKSLELKLHMVDGDCWMISGTNIKEEVE